ncbi:putative short-chain dehydrogenase/reductase family protein [Lasiosphaeris hirsuta]|uniref:Short-chain dehydrogenase/reductase family protein n=1 Tax=Lasiosphaeris hirsuta TaxID=260670 RepID=A0AA39ZRK1_9PEZI|nr:putative short-chain dehydrogenase/reductase family protein [Lasiosphaeris hirsuta]
MAQEALIQRLNLPLLISRESCAGGTYIVTGANTGLGFEAAKHLVAIGAEKVIMGVRNLQAGQEAKAKIEAATNIFGVADVWHLDLSSYDSVKAFAAKAVAQLSRIDALIENAAVAPGQRIVAEGHVSAVTVNVLSTFLLAVLLLPKMSRSSQEHNILPHIVIVTSRVSFDFRADWDRIKGDPLAGIDEELMPFKTYPLSKLLEVLVARHLSGILSVSRTGVVINLVCPGLCTTELDRTAPQTFRDDLAARRAEYGRTAEDGSRTLLHAAVAGEKSHGCLLHSCEIAEDAVPDWVTSEDGKLSQKRTWDIVAAELNAAAPGAVESFLNVQLHV